MKIKSVSLALKIAGFSTQKLLRKLVKNENINLKRADPKNDTLINA